jgi:DNA repair protein RadA/Sms
MSAPNASGGRRYACAACGHVHNTWRASCATCGKFQLWPVGAAPSPQLEPATKQLGFPTRNVDNVAPPSPAPRPMRITDVPAESFERLATDVGPLDDVLGGGIVAGSVIVLAGEPGSAKSTLTMHALAAIDGHALYITGEETIAQAAERARRIGADKRHVHIAAETDLDVILGHVAACDAQIVAIDSIQTIACDDFNGAPGSPTQIRECANRLVRFAKGSGVAVWLVGHVTADGTIAGPKTMIHLVDVALELEHGERREDGTESDIRMLRCPRKNRFGPTGKVGRFVLTSGGLVDAEVWAEEEKKKARKQKRSEAKDEHYGVSDATGALVGCMCGFSTVSDDDLSAHISRIVDGIDP